MPEVTVIIPNYNGRSYLEICLAALERQTFSDKKIIVVDNGSADGSAEWVRRQYPQAEVLALEKNYGFCGAVNRGVQAADSPYVLLLNNDTEPEPEFVEQLVAGIRSQGDVFSCQAKLLDYRTGSGLTMPGTITAPLAGPLPEERGSPRPGAGGRMRFLPPAEERPFTAELFFRSWEALTNAILLIWRTLT